MTAAWMDAASRHEAQSPNDGGHQRAYAQALMATGDSAYVVDEDQAALRAAAAGDAALCTIVGIDGSFSRRIGAQLAVGPDGTIVGSLADGCLEQELVRQAAEARGRGEARMLRYGKGSPFIDFRLPCGSGIDVLVEPFPDRALLSRIVAALDGREAAHYPLPSIGRNLLDKRPFLPSLRLALFGTGPEVVQLVQLAHAYGVETDLHEPGPGLALGRAPQDVTVDPWTAIVLLFHDHEWEHGLLDWALSTDALYIGAQGGREARETRHARLAASGHGTDAIRRVISPVGLIPHSRHARSLALSILADVVGRYEALRR